VPRRLRSVQVADLKLRVLAPLFEYCSVQVGGEPVLEGGKVAGALCILVSGQVLLPAADGAPRPLLVAGGAEAQDRGQWFGGRSLLRGEPMSGDAVVHAPSLLLRLEGPRFKQLMNIAPEIEAPLVTRE